PRGASVCSTCFGPGTFLREWWWRTRASGGGCEGQEDHGSGIRAPFDHSLFDSRVRTTSPVATSQTWRLILSPLTSLPAKDKRKRQSSEITSERTADSSRKRRTNFTVATSQT